MKFRIWAWTQNIKRKYTKIKNCYVVKWLKNTLIYNIAKMFCMVFLILWVIFLFAPKVAHVSFLTNEVDAVGEIYADHINMNLETDRFRISDFNELNIGCLGNEGYEVNGEFYDNSYKLYTKSYDGLTGTIFITTENIEEEEFNITSFLEDDSRPVYINYIDSEYSIKCQDGFQIKFDCNIHLTFYESDAFLVKEGQENIPIYTCTIRNSDKYSSVLTTNQNVKLSVMDYLGMETDNKADITLWGVNKISGKASGDLFFSYSPDSKQYHLNKQIVYLGSEKNSLEINIILDNGIRELNINGMVNEASISKMNLFPTFWGWYRDNIYLTPLTLLTTIFGGVTLMINNKKKNS
ncbi:hypothetical protein D7V83_18105 [bacterium 0.1xD8-71]|nr:hypothetical protein D7V83_18105 [bacterium 0.1xD8-71]